MRMKHHPRLPNEILTDIFSRVHAKSVGKFKCLSKTWNTILSTPHFIKLHLSRNTHQQSLLLLSKSKSLHVINPPIENQTISKKLQLENTWYEVVGSCNGLVMLLNSEKEMFLINPTTLEQFKLPNLTFDDSKKLYLNIMHGFGYDSSNDDYKILVVSGLYSFGISRSIDTLVHLYSVKSGVWRRINHSLNWFSPCGIGAFVNGSIHWHVYHYKSTTSFGILAFNLTTEVFHELDVPFNFSAMDVPCSLFAHEGRLCALNPLWGMGYTGGGLTEKVDIWKMKEYGVANSWTKLGTFDGNREWYILVPSYFSRDEDIVMLITQNTMVLCNLQEGTFQEMIVDGVSASFRDGCSFVSSLVSLKGIASSS